MVVWVFIGLKIFVASPWRRVSTQQRRDLLYCVPECGKKATHQRRALCRCGPERYTPKMLCLLRNGVEFYAAAY